MGTKENPRPKKSGGLYIRRRNVWNEVKNAFEERDFYQATEEIRDPENPEKRIRITGTASTPDEARKRLIKSRDRYYSKRSDAKAGIVVKQRSRSGQTVEQYLEWWIAGLKPSKVSKTMRSKYAANMRHHVIPYVGHIYLSQLNEEHLNKLFETTLPEKKKIVRGVETNEQLLGSNARLNIYKHLRTALKYAVEKNLITNNPLVDVDVPTYEPPEENIPHMMKVVLGMFAAMDEAEDPARDHFLFALLGLRRGERLALSFDDIKLKSSNPSVKISKQLSRVTGEGLHLKNRTKTGTAREIPLFEPWLSVVKRMEAKRKDQLKLESFKPTEEFKNLVFLNDNGKPWDLNTDNTYWDKINERYNPNTPKIRGHALRHCAATYLADLNIKEEIVREVLGHETVAMGHYYQRMTQRRMREELQRVAEEINTQTTSRKKRAAVSPE